MLTDTDKVYLILNFDVNKTLIATDLAANKTADDNVIYTLANYLQEKWQGENGNAAADKKMTYVEYLKKIKVPYKNRSRYYSDFMNYLKRKHPSLYKSAKKHYDSAEQKLKIMNKSNQLIFQSFYNLISLLDTLDFVKYKIIIRTFGTDIPELEKELYKKLGWRVSIGKFKHNTLLIDSGNEQVMIKDKAEIYNFLKCSKKHIAISDDYFWWDKHNMSKKFAKPFIFDSSDKGVLSVFFDDSITDADGPINIINPIDLKTDRSPPVPEIINDGLAHKINMIDALIDDDYYIKLVKKSLSKSRIESDSTYRRMYIKYKNRYLEIKNSSNSTNI